jgi:hypothetical protein
MFGFAAVIPTTRNLHVPGKYPGGAKEILDTLSSLPYYFWRLEVKHPFRQTGALRFCNGGMPGIEIVFSSEGS